MATYTERIEELSRLAASQPMQAAEAAPRARQLWRQTEAQATEAHYAAERNGEYAQYASIAKAAATGSNGSAPTATIAHACECITRWEEPARHNVNKTIDATEAAAAPALQAALIARNHPNDRDALAAAVMALECLRLAALAAMQAIQAQSDIAKAAADLTVEAAAPGDLAADAGTAGSAEAAAQ